jgi:hypothetical protein
MKSTVLNERNYQFKTNINMKTKLILPEKVRYFLYTLLAVVLSRFVKPKYINLYQEGRRVGNTTRLIDIFVQDFFNEGKCQVYDHYSTRQSSQRVFDLVLQRLNREHHIEKQDVSLDRSRLIIRRNNR